MKRLSMDPYHTANSKMASAPCTCADENSFTASNPFSHSSRMRKRKSICVGKCRRQCSDEAHWSKILQTCQVAKLSPPPVTSSPPLSPIAAIGQSVCKFFKRFNTARKLVRKNSLDESDRPTSVSSEDSEVSELPTPKTFHERPRHDSIPKEPPKLRPIANTQVHILQTPSSSALLTKRYHDKQHRIQKPTPLVPAKNTNIGKRPNDLVTQLKQINSGALRVPNQTSPTGGHLPLTIASSCPLEQKRPSTADTPDLSRTWPLANHHLSYDDDEAYTDGTNSKAYLNEERNVQEFTIPHEDTHQEELIGCWKNGQIFRGKWHGDVMIQTYDGKSDLVSKEFWEEVKRMSRIRHENIALFMGACTCPGHLALVTGVCIGSSLYERLHICREKTTLAAKINLSYQIAQALAYLHAKKIVYRNMSSKNIFVEKQKAILSVINFGAVCKTKENRMDRMRGQLPYIAPEISHTIDTSTDTEPQVLYTPQADVYAFGILLHELISNTRPYKNIPASALIVQVCDGRRPSTDSLPCPQTLKRLMKSCWHSQPQRRPYTHDILKELQKKDVALHNRFSSSEPENINKLKTYVL